MGINIMALSLPNTVFVLVDFLLCIWMRYAFLSCSVHSCILYIIACQFRKWNTNHKIKQFVQIWVRFFDDILLFWIGSEADLEFINELNSVHSTSTFSRNQSNTEIYFLDVEVKLSQEQLTTGLFCKLIDRNSILKAFHPSPLKLGVPYSQN